MRNKYAYVAQEDLGNSNIYLFLGLSFTLSYHETLRPFNDEILPPDNTPYINHQRVRISRTNICALNQLQQFFVLSSSLECPSSRSCSSLQQHDARYPNQTNRHIDTNNKSKPNALLHIIVVQTTKTYAFTRDQPTKSGLSHHINISSSSLLRLCSASRLSWSHRTQ